jgi:hypothetical protein
MLDGGSYVRCARFARCARPVELSPHGENNENHGRNDDYDHKKTDHHHRCDARDDRDRSNAVHWLTRYRCHLRIPRRQADPAIGHLAPLESRIGGPPHTAVFQAARPQPLGVGIFWHQPAEFRGVCPVMTEVPSGTPGRLGLGMDTVKSVLLILLALAAIGISGRRLCRNDGDGIVAPDGGARGLGSADDSPAAAIRRSPADPRATTPHATHPTARPAPAPAPARINPHGTRRPIAEESRHTAAGTSAVERPHALAAPDHVFEPILVTSE